MREHQLDGLMSHEDGAAEKDFGDQELNNSANELSGIVHGEKAKNDLDGSASVDMVELRSIKRSSKYDDLHPDSKKCCTVNVDSDGETPNTGNKLSHMEEATKLASQIISSSESDSDSDDSDADISVNARYTGFTFYDCVYYLSSGDIIANIQEVILPTLHVKHSNVNFESLPRECAMKSLEQKTFSCYYLIMQFLSVAIGNIFCFLNYYDD